MKNETGKEKCDWFEAVIKTLENFSSLIKLLKLNTHKSDFKNRLLMLLAGIIMKLNGYFHGLSYIQTASRATFRQL